MPGAPSLGCADGLAVPRELSGACQQSIGLAECVSRNSIAPDVDLLRCRTEQRAAPQQAAFAVAASARHEDLTARRGQDGLKISPIRRADRQRGQLSGWDVVTIGRARVCTPVTNAEVVCRLLLDTNVDTKDRDQR